MCVQYSMYYSNRTITIVMKLLHKYVCKRHIFSLHQTDEVVANRHLHNDCTIGMLSESTQQQLLKSVIFTKTNV